MPLPIPIILAAIEMVPKLFKSKTAGANVGVGAAITVLAQFGINASPELVSAIFVIVNVIMRMITKQPLSEK